MNISGLKTQGEMSMKNKILLIVFSLFLSGGLVAQTGRLGAHDAISKWSPSTPVNSFSTVSEGRSIAQEIIDLVGLKANFQVREANIPNAAAVVYGGQRYVLYNPNFIRQLQSSTGTRWAGISVLAHEIGHHLNGHTITSTGSQPALELESDEFSGFVLRKMGASLAEAQAAMKVLASVNSSRTHPGQYDRLTAIADGWNKADGQITGRPVTTRPATQPQQPRETVYSRPAQTRTTQQPVISNRQIIGDVRFSADASTRYYITSQYNLVKVLNNKLAVIGKITSLNRRDYPYMISDQANTQLLVDAYGNILTKQGRKVGVISARG